MYTSRYISYLLSAFCESKKMLAEFRFLIRPHLNVRFMIKARGHPAIGIRIATKAPKTKIKQKMAHDIFDSTILCKNCDKKMQRAEISKNGYLLRAMVCPNCNEKLIHPLDEENYNKFINLRNKEFNVKMRLVGNSYAVSIPKEIVSFMGNQRKIMDDMVRLCFEEMGKLSLNFHEEENKNPRIIKSREVRVVKNGKPVLHSKQFYDSANPEKSINKTIRRNE